MNRPLIGINLLYVRPGYVGGTVRYAQELLKHLAQSNEFRWKIYVQIGAFPTMDPCLVKIPRKEVRIVGGLAGRVLFEHVMLPLIAEKDGVDLLFSPGFVSPLWGRFFKVVTIHDLYYKRFPEFVRLWQRRYWQLFVPNSIRKVDIVIANSETSYQDICEAFPGAAKKTKCIYLGANAGVSISEVVLSDDRPFCLVVGNMTPNKNIETIVSAFSLLKERQQHIRLIVAGSDLFGRLASALKQARVKPDIELYEHVSDGVLFQLYSQACCLIQASYYEGFGLPVAEAMSIGCPVIASDVSILHEICGEAAIYFPAQSSEALADAIQILILNEDVRQHHKKIGLSVAKKFRWEKTACETLDVFQALLK